MSSHTTAMESIIERIGGERDFKFVVLALVDRLRDNANLKTFFAERTFDTNNLAAHQEDFLRIVFTATNDADKKDANGRIRLRYYRLVSQGFNERHYDMMVRHFTEALEDAWICDQVLISDAVEALNSYRHIFETRGADKVLVGRAMHQTRTRVAGESLRVRAV